MSYQNVLNYWFEGEPLGKKQMNRWWKKDPSVDEWMKKQFGGLVDRVFQGEYQIWCETPEGHLTAIICLDQFPRNMYRGSPRSYQYDPLALELVQKGLSEVYQQLSSNLHKAFFLLPLMHDEDIASQLLCVEQYKILASKTGRDDYREYFQGAVRFAEKHLEIIEQFGRFPHRNEILGRISTGKEKEFLKQPGSSF